MKSTKYLGSLALAAFSSTIAFGYLEMNAQFEITSCAPRKRMITPGEIIESYYQGLNLKHVADVTPKKLPLEHQLKTSLQQDFSFDFEQPLTSQNVAKAIAVFLHAGDTPEALLICQKAEAVFKEYDFDKKAAKREGMQAIFKEALSLIEDEKQIKPKLQLTLQQELSELETRMNQGLEKALKFSHERQKGELLLALDVELDNFLQTTKKDNAKLPLISENDIHNLNERTKEQIEEKFVIYAKNPPAIKRIQALKQAEIRVNLDDEMDIFKARLKNQKDVKNRRGQLRTLSFFTPSSTETVELQQGKVLNERRWVIKAKAWEQKKQ
ncbi:MAG: hypothetical protein ACOH2E_02515 [Candidatus Paracaedibacter sp.]